MTATLTSIPTTSTVEIDETEGATSITGLPGHFCLHYQPQLDLHSGAILRAEALLRWWHPEFGLISPHASLSGTRWAEEVGGLEGWAAAEVCRQGARWEFHGLPVQVALNVSSSYLLRPGFVDGLQQELDRSGLNPYLLAIDIPTSALAMHPHHVERVGRALTDVGIGVILDGVVNGTRTESMVDIGAEAWKIDLRRAGSRRPGLHPSVRATVDAAHQAGAMAVAKAVEDDSQLADVRELGFDGVFGNVVSPPLSGRSARAEFRAAPPRLRPVFGSAD